MPNRFDRLEARLHKATTKAFGYRVVWLPSFGGDPIQEQAHIKDPNKYSPRYETEVRKVDYGMDQTIMEYYRGQFPGLMEAVRGGSDTETVTVYQTDLATNLEIVKGVYRVSDVNKIADGDTIVAKLVIAQE